jgi:hypothetical protein
MLKGYRLATKEENRYYCLTYIPEIAGKYKGTLVIYGGGKSMWDDYKKIQDLGVEHDTMAVNIAGLFIPKLKHLYSLHYKNISYISNWRKVEYGADDKHICHSSKEIDGVDHVWPLPSRASTSGLMALILGHLLGYEKLILCGVPMDGSGYFYKPFVNDTFGDRCRAIELSGMKQLSFGNNIRSMSGRSKEAFGEPTIEWIKEDNHASTIRS